MIVFIYLLTIFLMIWFYQSLDGRAYRNPFILLMAGITSAGIACILKIFPSTLSKIFSPEDIAVSMLIIDPLLGGLAGGLVASAVVARVQLKNIEDSLSAQKAYKMAFNLNNIAKSNLQKKRRISNSFHQPQIDSEFQKEIQHLINSEIELRRAEDNLREFQNIDSTLSDLNSISKTFQNTNIALAGIKKFKISPAKSPISTCGTLSFRKHRKSKTYANKIN